MKKPSFKQVAEAFALVELLVLLVGVLFLVALLLPAMVNNARPRRMGTCMTNLKQVGLGLQMFADDNNSLFPPQVSISNGGSLELLSSNSPALHFQSLSNYLSRSWRVFCCPADESKQPFTNNGVLTDHNVSYFLSVDAKCGMTTILHAGDRNLEVAWQAIKPGLFTLTTNTGVGWTREMHSKHAGTQCGNLLFADGHVQYLRTNLSAAIQSQGLATNRLAVP